MAIVGARKPKPSTEPKPNPPVEEPIVTRAEESTRHLTLNRDYRDSLVDSRYFDFKHLLTHVEGSSWTVRYFRQVLRGDEAIDALDQGGLDVTQSYERFDTLEIKVTSALSPSQSADTQEFSLSGSGVIYVDITPHAGDMFLADVGDGKIALFTIDEVIQKAIIRDTVYEVNYRAVEIASDAVIEELDRKTVRTFKHMRKRSINGHSAVLTTDNVDLAYKLEDAYKELLTAYSKEFIDKAENTIVFDNTYDYWLAKYYNSMVSNDLPHAKIDVLHVEFYDDEPCTVLEHLTDRYTPIHSVKKVMRKAKTFEMDSGVVNRGVLLSDYTELWIPADIKTYVHKDKLGVNEVPYAEQPEVTEHFGTVDNTVSYIFSPEFYSGNYANYFEREVVKLTKDHKLDHITVYNLFELYLTLETKERFYYGPVLAQLLYQSYEEI